MAKRIQRKKVDPALAEIQAEIRDAEKAQAPIHRESIGLSLPSMHVVARLVKTGHYGKKPAVLQQALAIGLEALDRTGGDNPATTTQPWTDPEWRLPALPSDEDDGDRAERPPEESPSEKGAALLGGVTAGSFAFSSRTAAPITTPPSQLREKTAETGDVDE